MSDELAALWEHVAHVARARVAVLERAAQALADGADDTADRCAAAVEEAHKLVGSLDSYGRRGGSATALRVATLLARPAPPPDDVRDAVAALRLVVGPD